MTRERIVEQLREAGLHEESTERLVDHFEQIQTALREEQFGEVGMHVGNFCENLSNILRVESGEEVDQHPDLGTFVNRITSGGFEEELTYELKIMVPHAMRTAYDLRSRRDTVHINLQTPVNYADAALAERLCSWMLAELVREYGSDDDIDQIHELLEELATPIEAVGPLEVLDVDLETRNKHRLGEVLKGLVEIDPSIGQMVWTPGFSDLTTENRVIAALLRQRAGVYRGIVDENDVGVSTSELADIVDCNESTVRNHISLEFITSDSDKGGYLIQEADVEHAVTALQQSSV